MSRQSICGKCKVARLPGDLAVHVKVGDDYKIVCILQAWEIKRLATTVRRQLPTGGCSPFSPLLVFAPSLPLLSVCQPPRTFTFCTKKGVHEWQPLEQQKQ